MKRILLATTALFALSGVTVAAADVSVSGHVRFQYDAWSDKTEDGVTKSGSFDDKTGLPKVTDVPGSGNNNNSMSTDPEIWIKGNMVTDSGLTVAPEIRLNNLHDSSKAASARHYIKLADDWGTLTLGRQHSVARTMSLDADWRGTVSGADVPAGAEISENVLKSSAIGAYAGDPAVIYQTPDFSGFQAGVYFSDAGAKSKANATDIALTYSIDAFDDGGVKIGYISNRVAGKDGENATKKNDNNQIGVELTSGDLMASVVQTKTKATPKSGGTADKQTAQELEVAYSATDSLTLNMVYFTSKNDEGTAMGDKYKSTGVGVKYTIAPGLWTSLGYTTFKHTPKAAGSKANEGNGMRIRVHAGF